MKAVLCKSYGPPDSLVVENVPSPQPAKGQVVISVKAAGVNFPDVLIIQNKYQFRPPLPFSPGGEVAGVIKALGEGVAHFKVGDPVIGSIGWGGYAEEVVCDAGRLIALPEGIDFVHASAFVLTYGTSAHALKDRAHLKAGESLLVLGAAGGVGLAAVEIGKVMGARVYAAVSSQEKLDVAMKHGAVGGLVYPTGPLDREAQKKLAEELKALVGGDGFDVIYDPVGGDYAEPALRSIAWEGRYLVVGFPAGIPKLPLNLTLLKSCDVCGVFWGAFAARDPKANQDHVERLFRLWKEGAINPLVTDVFAFEDGGKAIAKMAARGAIGKLVVKVAD